MDNNNIFLQLRQKDAEEVYKNGDYATQFRRPMVLEQGDQIIVNKSIIDSRGANSGKIVLEDDTDIGFKFYYYVINFSTDAKYADVARTIPKTQASVDNDYYIACGKVDPSGFFIVDLKGIDYSILDQSKRVDSFTAKVEYTDLHGNLITSPITMTYNPKVNLYQNFTDKLKARKKGNQTAAEIFRDATDNQVLLNVGSNKNTRDIGVEDDPSLSDIYVPILVEKSITMPAGNYTPADFAERLTRFMTTQQQEQIFTNTIGPVENNNILISTNDPILTTKHVETCFIKMKDGLSEFFYGKSNENRYVGSNIFELNVDTDTNRFKFNYTHFPFYNAGTQAIVYKPIDVSNTEFTIVSSYSGIIFADFFSKQAGKEINLWEKQLGFDIGAITMKLKGNVDNPTLGVRTPVFNNPILGSQATTGNVGIDVGVEKTGSFTNVPELVAGVNELTTNIGDATLPIGAKGDIAATNFDFGYYLVELQGGMQTDLITNNSMKTNIFSVVGRYYENQNYTTGSSADAIIYQHTGATQYLNSMRVRFLNSDFNVPNDLGDDNTLFIQHIKAPKQPQEAQEKKEKK